MVPPYRGNCDCILAALTLYEVLEKIYTLQVWHDFSYFGKNKLPATYVQIFILLTQKKRKNISRIGFNSFWDLKCSVLTELFLPFLGTCSSARVPTSRIAYNNKKSFRDTFRSLPNIAGMCVCVRACVSLVLTDTHVCNVTKHTWIQCNTLTEYKYVSEAGIAQ
jgi:hypothetical protein